MNYFINVLICCSLLTFGCAKSKSADDQSVDGSTGHEDVEGGNGDEGGSSSVDSGTADSGAGSGGVENSGSKTGNGGQGGSSSLDSGTDDRGVGGGGVEDSGGQAGTGGQDGSGGKPPIGTESDAAVKCGLSTEQVTMDQMQKLVRDYVFKVQPGINPAVTFGIEELIVPSLWETMRLKIFRLQFLTSDGVPFNESPIVYHHDGIIEPFACAIGGHGLMSGAVLNGALYYSYSWGSGIHRSHVGKMSWNTEDCTLSFMDAGGFINMDMLVYAHQDEIWVDYDPAPYYHSFNSWEDAKRLGRLEETGNALTILNEAGSIVTADFPPYLEACYGP